MFRTKTLALAAIAALTMMGAKQAKAESWLDFLDFSGFKRNTKLEMLATITNDRSTDTNTLSGMIDDRNDLTGIDFASVSGGHQTGSQQYPMSKVTSGNGVVLINSQGIDAVQLRGKLTGGEADLIVKFIYNGMTGEYHECKVKAVRGTDNVWHMKNAYTGKIFSKVKIITWQLGIQTMQGLCP